MVTVAQVVGSMAAMDAAPTNIHSSEYCHLHLALVHPYERGSLPSNTSLFLLSPQNYRVAIFYDFSNTTGMCFKPCRINADTGSNSTSRSRRMLGRRSSMIFIAIFDSG